MKYDRLSVFFLSKAVFACFWLFSQSSYGQISTSTISPDDSPSKTAPVLSEQEQKAILGFKDDTSSSRAVDFPTVESGSSASQTSGYTPPTGTVFLDNAAVTENSPIGKPRKAGQAVSSDSNSQGQQGDGLGSGQSKKDSGGNNTSLFRSLMSLFAVLTVIVVLAWLVRKLLPGQTGVSLGRSVQVVGRSAISTRHNLTLVRFGNDLLLLAVTGDNVRLIDKVTDPDKIAMLMGAIESDRVSSISKSFAGVFNKSREEYRLGNDLEDEVVIEEFQEEGTTTVSAAERELGGLLAKVKGLSKLKNRHQK